MANASVPYIFTPKSDEKVDYTTLATDMTYQLLKPEEATNFCISVSDVTEVISKVLYAADKHANNPHFAAAAAMDDDDDEENYNYHSYPLGLKVTRTITSGIPKNTLGGLIRDLGAKYIKQSSNLTSLNLILDFKGNWVHKFSPLPGFEYNYPDGLRETPGMVLDAREHNIPVHVSVIGYEFRLPFEGGVYATFYFLNPEYEHLHLPTIKAIFAAENQEQQILKETRDNISREQWSLVSKMDQEHMKIDAKYNFYNDERYDIPSYIPPNKTIATLHAKYTTNKEYLVSTPVPVEDCLGELKMPKFKMSSDTDILNSEEFTSSPLYPLFMDANSKVPDFIGKLVRLQNKTTITMNEEGAEAYSETDADFVSRGLNCDEPNPKNYHNIKMNRRFRFEICYQDYYSGVTTNYFTGKVVSP